MFDAKNVKTIFEIKPDLIFNVQSLDLFKVIDTLIVLYAFLTF